MNTDTHPTKASLMDEARNIRKELERVLPLDYRHLAVDVTNLAIKYDSLIRKMRNTK